MSERVCESLKDPDERDGIGLKIGPSIGLSNDHPVLDDEARAEFLQPLDEVDRAVAVAKEEDDVQTVFRIDHFFGKLELPKIQNCRVILAFGHDAQDDFDSIFLLKSNLIRQGRFPTCVLLVMEKRNFITATKSSQISLLEIGK